MDKQVKGLEFSQYRRGDAAFAVIKNVIINENKELFKKIAQKYKMDYTELEKKYLKPEYYLPLVTKK